MAWRLCPAYQNKYYDVCVLKGANAKECLLSPAPPAVDFKHTAANMADVKVALQEVINRLTDVGVLSRLENRSVALSTQLAKTSPNFAQRVIQREDLLTFNTDELVLNNEEYRILNDMYTRWNTIFKTTQNKVHYFDFIKAYLRIERELNALNF